MSRNRDIKSVKIGDSVHIANNLVITRLGNKAEMGGIIIGFDEYDFPILKIDTTPAAYVNWKNKILTIKDYEFIRRKMDFSDIREFEFQNVESPGFSRGEGFKDVEYKVVHKKSGCVPDCLDCLW